MIRSSSFAFTLAATLLAGTISAQSRLKVIVDQGARGPCTTDIQSILVFVQSPRAEVLGITIVSGDLWMEQDLRHTLRALEIAGRTDIPVYRGAVFQKCPHPAAHLIKVLESQRLKLPSGLSSLVGPGGGPSARLGF